MKTTCLISNFNYAAFVGDAIESALRQTVPFDQIVVVDDGSTDGSVELLTAKYGSHPLVEIVAKDNRGQLSCFNEGFARTTGEIVFFLDADDIYEPDYVERALHIYQGDRHCDFLFCGRRLFGEQERLSLKFATDRDLGYSVLRTAFFREWIGEATSCLSMRRQVLEKFLPLPFVDQWRVRADDCLIFGASLAGARKRYLAQPLVKYRVHTQNHFLGRKADKLTTYRRRLAISALFEHLEQTLCLNPGRLAEFAHREFHTLGQPTLGEFVRYVRICLRGNSTPLRQLASIAEMAIYLLSSRRRHLPSPPSQASQSLERPSVLPFRPTNANDESDPRKEALAEQYSRRAA